MAFIPKDAKWYVAQIVVEFTVAGDPRNAVHINYLLVRADSPSEAYEKALRLGSDHETTYLNPDMKQVKARFHGLRDLNVVYEDLAHGAELLYEEKVALNQEEIGQLVRPIESLAVFKGIQKSEGPDYSSGEVVREAKRLLESSGTNGE